MAGVIVQYIVLRSDLIDKLSWPLGAVITQACHASSAIIHLTRDDQICQQYVADLDNMHKVVLKISSEEELRNLSETLAQSSIEHKLWIEQPENIATCLATKPYTKETLQKYFKKLKLYK